ncbi:hypothetical protein FA95DRAFT_1606106 [Auriscalpium vulgare]|uniref:Uncharacterized protein n=1 Tax=Auriscalpium vulgare TaxID=40419 RepID=A0ACB8RU81_9AGAM|nr:hypothetical protein FA95DRAFT_1606106 [Auriscalpium vulgare]
MSTASSTATCPASTSHPDRQHTRTLRAAPPRTRHRPAPARLNRIHSLTAPRAAPPDVNLLSPTPQPALMPKASLCLDLRSQLAVDEADRCDLKIKWEHIVHREFGRTGTAPPSSVSASAPTKSAHSRSVSAWAIACSGCKSNAVTQVSHPPAPLKVLHLTNLTEIKAPEAASGFAADLRCGRDRALKTMMTFA